MSYDDLDRSCRLAEPGAAVAGLLGAFLFGSLLLTASVARAEPASASLPPVVGAAEVYSTNDRSGLGLLGFDPVSYFLPEGPKPGSSDIEVIWKGTAWRFASAANRAAFERDPETYAPRIGGYDATAAARGLVVDANVSLYVVRGGRLYLFRTDHDRARFMADPTLADQAEAHWPALRQSLVHSWNRLDPTLNLELDPSPDLHSSSNSAEGPAQEAGAE